MRRFTFLAVLVSLAAACASAGTGGDGVRRDRNVITEAEITPLGVSTAFEVIQRLRPHMLRLNGPTTLGGGSNAGGASDIVVYVNGMRQGGREVLSSLSAMDVKEIQYLDSSSASIRFGTGHSYGAIMITTKGHST